MRNHHLPRRLSSPLAFAGFALGAAFCAPLVQAVTILAVDFDTSSAVGDTETGFNKFNVTTGDVGPVTVVTYGAYTVRLAGDSSIDGNGLLDNSDGGTTATGYLGRKRSVPAADTGSFTYSELYKDIVIGKDSDANSLVLQIAGLEANTAYSLTLYSYDGSSTGSQSTFFTNRTGLSAAAAGTALGSVSWTNPYTFDSSTPNSVFSLTTTITSDANGLITIASGGGGFSGRMNGFEIATVPEPATSLGLGFAGLGLLLRRRQRRR